jgi:glutamate-ammonia-ligase adenylyltransferase
VHYLELLRSAGAAAVLNRASSDQARVLTSLWCGSQALSELLVAQPAWLPMLLDLESLRHPRSQPGFSREVNLWLEPLLAKGDYAAAFARLRMFKQREMLRIATRDLARLGRMPEITGELSDVADVCLSAVYRLVYLQLTARLGGPWHLAEDGTWQPTQFCVLGMGKLGGQELNYSSDVDVLFVYTDEGYVFKEPPARAELTGRGVSNHQFFKHLAEAFVSEVSRVAPEGQLYRIDCRLRPEGNAGPLARSLASYENYYAQWGQTWERMMLVKARCVAGDAELAGEFLEMVQSFRFPRLLSEQALGDIALMKQRIESQLLKAGERERNIKLGRGGIREIEFVVQALQVLNAGGQPFLSDAHTLTTIQRLLRYQLLPGASAEVLAGAYEFLRDVEHRLQMENNLQTHTIPAERRARERLAALMGFASLRSFEVALGQHRRQVREVYDTLFQLKPKKPAVDLPAEFEGLEPEWRRLFANHAFRDPEKACRLAAAFVQGPGFGHVSARTAGLARQLLAQVLSLCPRKDQSPPPHAERYPDGDPVSKRLSDPDRVLARLDSFVAAYGARATLFETWAAKPSLFELVVLLFDRSEFLAETAIRTPDLVDELELSGRLRQSKTAEQTLKDLRYGLGDADQRLWLRRYHQAELMRIGLRDILGLADFEQNHVELSALADACLQYALEVVSRNRKLSAAPFAIIGLGKLGGAELNYGSDLDLMFVADNRVRNLAELQRLAVEIIGLIASPTELGSAFPIDVRLRPDGEKGLLVNTLKAYEEYYQQRGRLWELQALSRSRPIAGHPDVGQRFQALAGELTDFRNPGAAAAGRDPNWKQEIAKMRLRIERERTPAGQETLAIKTGAGGLVDAEFIAQALCLAQGWREPNTLRALELARQQGVLPKDQADSLITNYRRLRRVESILRRWSYVGETTLPDDPAPLYRVSVRCGFTNAADFMRAVGRYRQCIREVYLEVFA